MLSSSTNQVELAIRAFAPNASFYSVIVTCTVVFFTIGRFFWKHEDDLRKDYIDKVKELLLNFSSSYIEPILVKKIKDSMETAYIKAFNSIKDSIFEQSTLKTSKTTASDYKRKLIKDDELKKAISEEGLNQKLANLKDYLKTDDADNEIKQYFASNSGSDLLNGLDKLYDKKSELIIIYNKLLKYCQVICYIALLNGILLIIGLLQLVVEWNQFIMFFWIFTLIETSIIGLVYFIKLEYSRRVILKNWETLKLYEE